MSASSPRAEPPYTPRHVPILRPRVSRRQTERKLSAVTPLIIGVCTLSGTYLMSLDFVVQYAAECVGSRYCIRTSVDAAACHGVWRRGGREDRLNTSTGSGRHCDKKAEGHLKGEVALTKLKSFFAAFATCVAVGVVLMLCRAAAADDYPNRPIVLVIPLPPGGTNDIMARAVADKMSAALGQRIVIENRNAGGSGTVGTREVAHAAPDGYTIILGYTSTLATGPNLYRNVGYDPRKDFAPIGLIASAPALCWSIKTCRHTASAELIALMKGSQEPYQVGTPGIGTVNYLASVLFAQQAGVKVEQIPEKGSNPLITDMMGGFVKVGFNPIPVSRAALDGGYIRALAVTSQQHSTLMPQFRRSPNSGLPGFDATFSYGLLAPAGTPRPIVERLNKELRAALASDDVKKRIILEGGEPGRRPPKNTPQSSTAKRPMVSRHSCRRHYARMTGKEGLGMLRRCAATMMLLGLMAPTAYAEPQTVRIQLVRALAQAPYYIAIANGYFDKEGITIESTDVRSALDTIAPLATGQLDVSFGAATAGFFNAAHQAFDLRVVASMGYQGPVMATQPLIRKAFWDDGTVRSGKDFRGRKVAINAPGDITEYFFT